MYPLHQNCNFLDPGCINIGDHRTTQHEFIHAFGFDHEQNRSDRNDHVEILWNNIQGGYEDQYYAHKKNSDSHKQFGTPYDGRSIMHYKKDAFGKKDWQGRYLDTMKSLVRIHFFKYLWTFWENNSVCVYYMPPFFYRALYQLIN